MGHFPAKSAVFQPTCKGGETNYQWSQNGKLRPAQPWKARSRSCASSLPVRYGKCGSSWRYTGVLSPLSGRHKCHHRPHLRFLRPSLRLFSGATSGGRTATFLLSRSRIGCRRRKGLSILLRPSGGRDPPYSGSSAARNSLKKCETGCEMLKHPLVGWDFHDCGTLKALGL